jgi:uncharacterized protein
MMYSNYPIGVVNSLMRRVFGWMALGLSLTGITAFIVTLIPDLQKFLLMNPGIFLILILAQLGLVGYLSFGIQRMSREAAMTAFTVYSILTGATLSMLFVAYTPASLALTFFVCAGMFAAMSFYGYFTQADLSGMGSMLFMGLIGLIIALVINAFLRSPQLDFVTAIFGVIIFTLFTAYDVQMVKRMGMAMMDTGAEMTKVSIISALKLYLDFINLFLFLLRFLGQRRS